MSLQIQPETEISSSNVGSVVYVGDWDEALVLLAAFRVGLAVGVYSFTAFQPPVLLSAAPTQTTATTAADWATAESTISAADQLVALSARLRAMPGGLGQLTIELTPPLDLRRKVRAALATTIPVGERSYSFGVSETPKSILEAEVVEVQDHINAWLAAPTALKSRFLYINASTGANASLTDPEKVIARKILNGDDTVYTYAPTITLTISNAPEDPTDLPDTGATGTPAIPPTGTVHPRLPAGTWSWRVTSSGTAQNADGTWSGGVTWEGKKES